MDVSYVHKLGNCTFTGVGISAVGVSLEEDVSAPFLPKPSKQLWRFPTRLVLADGLVSKVLHMASSVMVVLAT